jgi:hypothetical protein
VGIKNIEQNLKMKKMKKILLLLLTILFILPHLDAQTEMGERELGSRSLYIDEHNYIGFSSQYFIPVDVAASNVKNNFTDPLKIISFVGYPLEMFTNDANKNLENFFDNQKYRVSSNYANENYMAFITAKLPDGSYQGRFYSSIDEHAFSNDCQNKSLLFNALINHKFKSNLNQVSNEELYGAIEKTLNEIDLFLDSGCNTNISQLFDVNDFTDFNYGAGQVMTRKMSPTQLKEYNNGSIKSYGDIHLDDANMEEIFGSITNSNDEYGISYSVILSSKEDEPRLNEILEDFYSSQNGKIIIWIHFDFYEDPPGSKNEIISSNRNITNRVIKIKTRNTLSEEIRNKVMDDEFEKSRGAINGNCTFPSKTVGTDCILPNYNWFGEGQWAHFGAGIAAGMLDALMETIYLVDEATSFKKKLVDFGVEVYLFQRAPLTYFANEMRNFEVWRTSVKQTAKDFVASMKDLAATAKDIYNVAKSLNTQTLKNLAITTFNTIYEIAKQYIKSGEAAEKIGLILGKLAFNALVATLTGGIAVTATAAYSATKTAIKGSKVGASFLEFLKKFNKPTDYAKDLKSKLGEPFMKAAKLCLQGCFVSNTPIWLANQSVVQNGKLVALASLPFVTVPIQSANLLDYTVAHKNVNSSYGLVAHNDINNIIFDKDPFTSDQQRERDEYIIDQSNWNEVVFDQEDGTSICKFALHSDWIQKNGYELNKTVVLNIPEQNINGPFKITSIKHILPQKIPSKENLSEDFDFRAITAISTHETNNVWLLKFENGDSIGVTYVHPIYTNQGWKPAGELEAGEEVLTYNGYKKVVSNNPLEGKYLVYNLEVKDLHNFLVGDEGAVVHNDYSLEDCLKEIIADLGKNNKPKNKTNKGNNAIGPYNSGTNKVRGHHIPPKSAFKDDPAYNENDAWSISPEALDEETGIEKAHSGCINGAQGKAYREWYRLNSENNVLKKELTLADIIEIELNVLISCGISLKVARGWIAELLRNFKGKNITNIPYMNKPNKIN